MKALFHLMVLMVLTQTIKAQSPPDHLALMNSTWELLDMMKYKPDAKGKPVAYFPPILMEMNKAVVELPGYMVPLKSGFVHSDFMLSVLPVLQCQFCGHANIPKMVEVHLLKPIPYTDRPFDVKGTLILNGTDANHAEFILENASAGDLQN
jgi:hypothetical protein